MCFDDNINESKYNHIKKVGFFYLDHHLSQVILLRFMTLCKPKEPFKFNFNSSASSCIHLNVYVTHLMLINYFVLFLL